MIKKLLFLLLIIIAVDLSAQVNFQWIRKFNTGGTVSESRLITTD